MKPSRLSLLAVLASLLVVISVTLISADQSLKSRDSFFALREEVNKHLLARIAAPLPGTTRALPVDEHLALTLQLFPDRDFIEHTLKQRDWSGGTSANIILNLDEQFLAQHPQGDSQSMMATVLLEHYLQDLEKLGFRGPGSPGCAVGMVQMANDYRFVDGDPSITVHAIVFVAPQERQAIIRLETHERLR
ncbi:hypothetical protein [Blastopirellula retiformator]|uniref:Uncharacterized protein n=1 Tax=Blastopirellula retiformator TaxID=2527970 RepID=A0A5C5UWX4_9BACT|nr:hypothetical protein [Blastopirellula retiformator]TWT30841.1 hypothetical protein Enr8_43670 [Blastopirellula retiformator]